MAKKTMTVDVLAATELRDGWTVSTGDGWLDFDGVSVWERGKHGVDDNARFVKFERTVGDLHVIISFTARPLARGASKWDREHSFRGSIVEGQTIYNGRCFTRRGIDVSSCTLVDKPEYGHDYNDVMACLDGEWTRCVEAHSRSKSMVDVPGLPGGWRVTPERKQQITEQLKAGRSATFTPHGMGTGYEVRTKKVTRWATALPTETSAFFGISGTLYYTTLDCD
jgi:hypothetical protein